MSYAQYAHALIRPCAQARIVEDGLEIGTIDSGDRLLRIIGSVGLLFAAAATSLKTAVQGRNLPSQPRDYLAGPKIRSTSVAARSPS